jgi:hypothetical protein
VLCSCAVRGNRKQEGEEEEEREKKKKMKKNKRGKKEKNMVKFSYLKNFREKNKRQFMKLVKIIFI